METVQRACDTVSGRRRPGPGREPVLPTAPFLAKLACRYGRRLTHREIGDRVGMTSVGVRGVFCRGLSPLMADRWAVAFGWHPSEVWTEWHDLPVKSDEALRKLDQRLERERRASMSRHPSMGRWEAPVPAAPESGQVVSTLTDVEDAKCAEIMRRVLGGLPDAA